MISSHSALCVADAKLISSLFSGRLIVANEQTGQTRLHLADTSASDSLRLLHAPSKDVLPLYFDVAYSGLPVQCSSKDTTCQQLQRDYRFDGNRAPMLADQENQYKYVLDVDANYASGKFKRLMCVVSLPGEFPCFLFSILPFAAPADSCFGAARAGVHDRWSSSRASSSSGGRSGSCPSVCRQGWIFRAEDTENLFADALRLALFSSMTDRLSSGISEFLLSLSREKKGKTFSTDSLGRKQLHSDSVRLFRPGRCRCVLYRSTRWFGLA